jgi:hypothetical protein
VNLPGDNIDAIKKNRETLIDGSKEIGLETNVEKTNYMLLLLSRYQKVGQNQDIKLANRSFENVSQFNYLGTTVRKQNLIQEEIKRRSNSGNALLPFGPEPSILSSAVEKRKNWNIICL